MSNAIYAVYGAAGCGRSLMPIAREQLARDGIVAEICFIDDAFIKDGVTQDMINGHRVYTYAAFKALDIAHKQVLIAIATSQVRAPNWQRKLHKMACTCGRFRPIAASSWTRYNWGRGAALSPFVTIGSNVQIGQCFHGQFYTVMSSMIVK